MLASIPIDKLQGNPFNTRRDMGDIEKLARSILASGLLQVPPGRVLSGDEPMALVNMSGDWVRKMAVNDLMTVQLAAGHRRLEAFRWLTEHGHDGYTHFPVELRLLTDEEMADIAWAENAERENPSPIEEAESIARAMKAFDWTQQQVADRWRLSRSGVANLLRLLNLPEEAKDALERGEITQRHGRVLLSAMGKSPAVYNRVAKEILPTKRELDPEVAERAKPIAREYHASLVANIPLEERICVVCGTAIEEEDEIVYHKYQWDGEHKNSYMCRDCWRAGTDWTPPSVAEAEEIESNAVRANSATLADDRFPTDVEIGKEQPGIRSDKCADCPFREGNICFDGACWDLKFEFWKSRVYDQFVARVQKDYGVTPSVRWEGYDGVNLSGFQADDVARIQDGTCAPGKCEHLFFRYDQAPSQAHLRLYPELPFAFWCDSYVASDECKARWKESKRTEEDRQAEREMAEQVARGMARKEEIEKRAAQAIAGALLEANDRAWEALAKQGGYATERAKNEEWIFVVARSLSRRFVYPPTDAVDTARLDAYEEKLSSELGKRGIHIPLSLDELVAKIERIEAFIGTPGEKGMDDGLRAGMSREQIAGNSDDLERLGLTLNEMWERGEMSEQEHDRLAKRIDGWAEKLAGAWMGMQ